MDIIKIKCLKEGALLPTRGTKYSVGYDLYSNDETLIKKGCHGLVGTGIGIDFDLDLINEYESIYGRIAPRSGLSYKKKTHVGAGVIDPDYRGEIKVLMFNFGDEDLIIQKGDKIAQLIFEKCITPKLEKTEIMSSTERGEGGFGSTGI